MIITRPSVPDGFDAVIAQFGNIYKYIRTDGTLSSNWESDHIVRITLPVSVAYAYDPKVRITRITVHKLLKDWASALYQDIYERGAWNYLGPYGGGFEYRANRNSPHKISLHAFGIAWDWDPVKFPNGSTERRSPLLSSIFKSHGFFMGEDFHHTKDPMHAQYAINC